MNQWHVKALHCDAAVPLRLLLRISLVLAQLLQLLAPKPTHVAFVILVYVINQIWLFYAHLGLFLQVKTGAGQLGRFPLLPLEGDVQIREILLLIVLLLFLLLGGHRRKEQIPRSFLVLACIVRVPHCPCLRILSLRHLIWSPLLYLQIYILLLWVVYRILLFFGNRFQLLSRNRCLPPLWLLPRVYRPVL